MNVTESRHEFAAATCKASKAAMKFEVVVILVSDVGRAKRFYAGLGWRLDIDMAPSEYYAFGPSERFGSVAERNRYGRRNARSDAIRSFPRESLAGKHLQSGSSPHSSQSFTR